MALGLAPTAPLSTTAGPLPAQGRHRIRPAAPEAWSSPDFAPPLWLVTMPTTGRDGRSGTQSFAVRAHTIQDAIVTAVACSGTDHAVLHRRGARIAPLRASAVLHR